MAGENDPVASILERVRSKAFEAMEKGWIGPPFDPLQLADILGIPVVPLEEVEDARLVHRQRRPRIEFNPNRNPDRVRFSIAHELAHLAFPDAAEKVRYRAHGEHARRDDWQVELLCNLGAAELLMPTGSFPELGEGDLEIEDLMHLRSQFMVSAESALLRAIRTTDHPAAFFAAARYDGRPDFRIDYVVGSRSWNPDLPEVAIAKASPLARCTAVGYTAKGRIALGNRKAQLECVGVPPYPGKRYPRIVGLIRPAFSVPDAPRITYLHGDATSPPEDGTRIIAHVVNDATSNWGGDGFAPQLRKRFPDVQDDFRQWATQAHALRLGAVHTFEVSPHLFISSMVAQRRYGKKAPRIPLRYSALEECLRSLAGMATQKDASVHMPMVGTGQAKGDWPVIEEMIGRTLLTADVAVTVYLLPGAPLPHAQPVQLGLRL